MRMRLKATVQQCTYMEQETYLHEEMQDTELHSNLGHTPLLSIGRQVHQASTSPTHHMQNIVPSIQSIIHTPVYWIVKSVLRRIIICPIIACKANTSHRLGRLSGINGWYTEISSIIKYRL